MPKITQEVGRPHRKRFESNTNSHVSTDRPISVPACEVPLPPSPPPADAWFQSKVMHPDLKNDRSSLDDEVAFFMSPCEVPLPPPPPPIAHLGHSRKRSYSSISSVDDEEEHPMAKRIRLMPCEVPLPPSPPPADAWFQSKVMHPDLKNDRSSLDDEVAFFMSPCEVPLPPPPPPVALLGHSRKRRYSSISSVDDEDEHPMAKRIRLMPSTITIRKPPSVTAPEVSPHPPDELPHLPEKRYLNLSTVAFPSFDD